MKDIVNKSFYLTSNFNNIKSDSNWPRNESILACDILSQLSEYKIFLPDLGDIDNVDLILKELRKRVKDIPKEYIITKKSFLEATGVSVPHAAREIKRAIRGLSSKIIITPHPLRPKNKNSVSITPWFSMINYDDVKGQIYVKLNDEAIERLIAFVKYSHIRFENIVKLSNQYSILTYLTIKILQEGFKQKHLVLTVEEYKEKLGLQGKYKDNNLFKKKVLDIVENEIDQYTDIEFKYQLIKEGRSYTKIRFNFDYKEKSLIANQISNNDEDDNVFSFNLSDVGEGSYFESILTSWGIRAKKVVEIEESYSINAINEAMEVTKQAIDDKTIKYTPAAFFIGTLENKELESQVEFERQQQIIREQQDKERQKQLAAEYEAIEKFINYNADELSNYLSIRSGGGSFDLSDSVKEHLASLSCVDKEKFKDFKPKFAILEQGFWDMKQRKEIRPNMYQFLKLIKFYTKK